MREGEENQTMGNKLVVEAEVTFLTREEGGRVKMPDLSAGRYMPHLVVQPPDIRKVVMTEGNIGNEDYLGVAFISGPPQYTAGQPGRFTCELLYYPEVRYEALQEGATFTVREGAKIVGFGKVIRYIKSDDMSERTFS
jgi:hypothetical protein